MRIFSLLVHSLLDNERFDGKMIIIVTEVVTRRPVLAIEF